MLNLRDERVHWLEFGVRLPRRGLVDDRFGSEERYEPVMAEYAVVDYGRAFGYVPAIGVYALLGRYVAFAGDDRESVPVPVDGACDDYLVPRRPARLLPVGGI